MSAMHIGMLLAARKKPFKCILDEMNGLKHYKNENVPPNRLL
jgi:hypothetical protein